MFKNIWIFQPWHFHLIGTPIGAPKGPDISLKTTFFAHFTKWTSIKVQTCIQDDFQTNLTWVINSWTIFGALIGAPWPVQSVQLGYFWEFSLLSSELHCKIYIFGAPIRGPNYYSSKAQDLSFHWKKINIVFILDQKLEVCSSQLP